MKDKLAIAVALALLTSGPVALAQDSTSGQDSDVTGARTSQSQQVTQGAESDIGGGATTDTPSMGQTDQAETGAQDKDGIKADALKGVDVKDAEDKTVGKVESVMVGQEGKVTAIVVTVGENDDQSRSSGQPEVNEQGMDQHLAASLIGLPVMNDKDEDIGEINNLLVDSEGRIAAAVIGVGGFLGLGEKGVGVAWDEISVLPNDEGARINMTREQLESAPSFKTQEESRQQQQQGQTTTTQQ
jgi:sporulation protein YlmC with PRC-barrel domain